MTGGRLSPPIGKSDHVQGSANAAVTLVEYGDFECSYCGMAYPIVKAMQQQLGDRLRFAFREFPLQEAHPHASHAAQAAEFAAKHGKFWEMHDAMYENQARLGDRALVEYAESLGLDGDALARALDDETYADSVRDQFMSGVRSGVNGTPTFFINGERFNGAWNDESEFASALEQAAGE